MKFSSLYFFKAPFMLIGAFLFFAGTPLSAQKPTFKAFDRQHPLSPLLSTTGTFDVVAVMVEFQPDSNRFTSGNGLFNPEYLNRTGILIDPPPHDAGYFQAHLDFAKHYFETVSNGAVQLRTHLISAPVRLPQKMETYSPLENSVDETFKLADMIADTWDAVRVAGGTGLGDLNPEKTAWVIFHAGAGRDLELLGTSLDKTPQDIPSLYLTLPRLSAIRPNRFPSEGILVDQNNRVRNSMLIPETESRRGVGADNKDFVIQLGINGILCANIGSFLGMPDLFNTENGQSGIGQFGLMDGAGFFAMNGVFPPEPSAWEKLDRGWITAEEISTLQNNTFVLDAISNRSTGRALKIPVTPTEYFLIENRFRNPDPAGVRLTIRKPDGAIVQATFAPEDINFDLINTDSLQTKLPAGVVIAVNHYDRALPGGPDAGEDGIFQTGERILNGGILIWHIDENVIFAKRGFNAINNDPLRRGVDLEEADGAQDIGLPVPGSLFSSLSSGTAFDFWWNGNDSRVILQSGSEISLYKNRFGRGTFPDNRSNSGFYPSFELRGFSANTLSAQFSIQTTGKPSVQSLGVVPGVADPKPYFAISVIQNDTVVAFRKGNTLLLHSLQNTVLTALHPSSPIPVESHFLFWKNALYIANGNSLARYRIENGTWAYHWLNTITEEFKTTPVLNPIVGFTVGTTDYAAIQGTNIQVDVRTGGMETLSSWRIHGYPGGQTYVENSTLKTTNGSQTIPWNASGNIQLFAFQQNGTVHYAVSGVDLWFSKSGKNVTVNSERSGLLFKNSAGNGVVSSFGASDLFHISETGAVQSGWPVTTVSPKSNQQLLFKKTDVSAEPVILIHEAANNLSALNAFSASGRRIDSLSLNLASESIWVQGLGNSVFILDEYGSFQRWNLPGFAFASSAETGDPNSGNLRVVQINDDETATDFAGFLNKTETYNWPNPVTDETHIRYQTKSAATIQITVVDQGGSIKRKITASTSGSQPEETLLSTAGWPSGIYFVLVKASSAIESDSKLIKMAVIR